MKKAARAVLWGIVFLVLTLLFYVFSPETDALSADKNTTVRLLTDGGVETLALSDYLPGVVAAEMPVSFGEEALKAQAVAARTYVMSCTSHEQADVCTDSGCCLAYMDEQTLQTFWKDAYEENLAAVKSAVRATNGEYLSYEGQAIQAVFHASSSGVTEDSGALWSPLPYLVSVDSPESAESVPDFITTVTVSADELTQTLGLTGGDDPSGWLEETTYETSGRVKTVCLCGATFSGAYIRASFRLRSTDFSLIWNGSDFVFTVSGNGHGVGMSQYGAKLLAAEGWSYAEILAHYYPGAALIRPENSV